MWKINLAPIPAGTDIVVRRRGKIHLHETAAFAFGDTGQAKLPFHFGGFQTDFRLAANIAAHKAKYRFPVSFPG